jgi:hypothetical protein
MARLTTHISSVNDFDHIEVKDKVYLIQPSQIIRTYDLIYSCTANPKIYGKDEGRRDMEQKRKEVVNQHLVEERGERNRIP